MASPEASLPSGMQIKLLMIGDSDVGKTCLMVRFAEDSFGPTLVTRGCSDCKIRKVVIDGANIGLEIRDTPGQERVMNTSCFREAQGIVLVYDVTDRISFESIKIWIGQIETHSNVHVNKILVGNKCDMLNEKVVSSEEGERLAKDLSIPFWECSAKNDVNVDLAFINAARNVRYRLIAGGQVGPESGAPRKRAARKRAARKPAGPKPAGPKDDDSNHDDSKYGDSNRVESNRVESNCVDIKPAHLEHDSENENDASESQEAMMASDQQPASVEDCQISSAPPASKYKFHSTSWLITSARHWERKKKVRRNVAVRVMKRNAEKNAAGWLRKIERDGDVNLKSHLNEEEKRLLLNLLFTLLPLEHTAFELVGHAWGVTSATVRNVHRRALEPGNSSTQRKRRRDAGRTVFDDEARRAATFTAAHAFKKQYLEAHKGESPSRADLAKAFQEASPEEIRKAEEQAKAFRDFAAILPEEVKKHVKQAKGKKGNKNVNYRELAQQITGQGSLQLVSHETIRNWVKQSM